MTYTSPDGSRSVDVLYDEQDDAVVRAYPWYVSAAGYVLAAQVGRTALRLHRVILELGPHDTTCEVDHLNGVGTDNRRSNLRVTTHQVNSANQAAMNYRGTSDHRGVHWSNTHRRWMAEVQHRGQMHFGGRHHTEAAAIAAVERLWVELGVTPHH